jgi:glyceraldehyde 3-phosphate dehydrogenase
MSMSVTTPQLRIGINGFGRIGRNFLRAALDRDDMQVVAINDLSPPRTLNHLLRFDSLRGRLKHDSYIEDDQLIINGQKIHLFSEADPADVQWQSAGADIILESTGRLAERAHEHLKNGVKKVVISSPSITADGMFVMSLNEETYDHTTQHVISNASCTVNCFGILLKILDDTFGVESAFISNIHSVSRQQGTQDMGHADLRMARAAGYNMVPQHPGAAQAFCRVMPQFTGKVEDYTLRVPVPIGSLNDISAVLKHPATAEEVNDAVHKASQGTRFKKYLEYVNEPIVSTDIISRAASCIFDAGLTQAIGTHVRVVGWHDNEWGYSNRLADLIAYIGNC